MNIASIKFKEIEKVYTNNKKQVAETPKSENKDTLEISDLGRYLNKVSSSEENMNMDKINDIKKRIENGTYRIDSQELAKKIIENMKGGI